MRKGKQGTISWHAFSFKTSQIKQNKWQTLYAEETTKKTHRETSAFQKRLLTGSTSIISARSNSRKHSNHAVLYLRPFSYALRIQTCNRLCLNQHKERFQFFSVVKPVHQKKNPAHGGIFLIICLSNYFFTVVTTSIFLVVSTFAVLVLCI